MNALVAVIGDIHGDLDQLRSLLRRPELNGRMLVFLGDYIDRGPDSKGVIDELIELSTRMPDRSVFLTGNHEEEFLRFLDGGPIVSLLNMGGSPTILSWLPNVTGDVRSTLLNAISAAEMQFLRSLKPKWVRPPYIAMHMIRNDEVDSISKDDLLILGHYIQRDGIARIVENVAYLDTGCGTMTKGKLTAMLLPEHQFISGLESE